MIGAKDSGKDQTIMASEPLSRRLAVFESGFSHSMNFLYDLKKGEDYSFHFEQNAGEEVLLKITLITEAAKKIQPNIRALIDKKAKDNFITIGRISFSR